MEENAERIDNVYGEKVREKDAKILNIMHEVERESGIKIFNESSNKLENLNNLEVLMKFE